uniref:Late embryogenesis abundant protein LEA-2 subgroup domain-containing protein n=1 Tax=Chenopodium quinoa TaxID=63459 RepID=A0A803N1W4_CHEQI
MTDRVYPAAKPNPPPAAINGGGGGVNGTAVNGAGPAKTGKLYNPNRPRPVGYRPPQNRRSRRSCSCRKCCCLTFIYTLIALLTLLLIAAIAACIFYVLYHPKHPTFSVSTIRISRFNLTSADPSGFAHLNSRLDFTLTAKNPNKKKITFVYDPMSVEFSGAGVDAGNATLPAFTHVNGNTTILKATVISDPTRDLDSDTIKQLKSDLTKKSGFPVTAELNTMVQVQLGKIKTKKIGIRVICDGIKGFQPKNATSKTPTPGTTSDAKCKKSESTIKKKIKTTSSPTTSSTKGVAANQGVATITPVNHQGSDNSPCLPNLPARVVMPSYCHKFSARLLTNVY